MLAATKPVRSTSPLRVLLVGPREEDFFLIREILERNRKMIAADLDHARSIEEAKLLLQQQPYGLVLFEHETGDPEALRLIAEFLQAGVSVPFILLTEDADESSVAEAIESGNWNCVVEVPTGRRNSGANDAQHDCPAFSAAGAAHRGRISAEAVPRGRAICRFCHGDRSQRSDRIRESGIRSVDRLQSRGGLRAELPAFSNRESSRSRPIRRCGTRSSPGTFFAGYL